jgi:hypothetical protein
MKMYLHLDSVVVFCEEAKLSLAFSSDAKGETQVGKE